MRGVEHADQTRQTTKLLRTEAFGQYHLIHAYWKKTVEIVLQEK